MRRAAAAVAVACALAAAPAQAGPYAGVVRSAEVTFPLTGADRRPWQVTARVLYSVAGSEMARYVVFRVSNCDRRHRCTYNRLWRQDLDLTQFTEAPGGDSATATTTIAGRQVTVEWVRSGGLNGSETTITGSSVEQVEEYVYTGTLTIGGHDCPDDHAGYGSERRSMSVNGSPFSNGPAPPAALPKGFGSAPRCG